MCGIIGVFNQEHATDLVKRGLAVMENRGKDGCGLVTSTLQTATSPLSLRIDTHKNCLGHLLHSMVGFVPQPIQGKNGWLCANCEIYNWQELNKKYKCNAENDTVVLLKLLEKKGISQEVLEELDGVFAFAYWSEDKVYIARDILGVKPVWYSHAGGFAFASEKKALEHMGYQYIEELNPRKILVYDIAKNSISFLLRPFFELAVEDTRSDAKLLEDLRVRFMQAVSKRIPNQPFGILFSGGVDSSLIALACKKLGATFTCYTAAVEGEIEAEDVLYAKKAAKAMDLTHKVVIIPQKKVPMYLKKVVPLIEDSNVVKVGVALPFFVACEEARKDGLKVIFSGLGSEELFGGYQRHKLAKNINLECLFGLLKMYERDLYRDDVVTMNNNLELREPFLDKALLTFALTIPGSKKICGELDKWILRRMAEDMGLPKEIAWRKKRAAQYGSRFDRALEKLSKKEGHKTKSAYLRTFYPTHNVRLAALISGGKDSLYAAHLMKKQNYELTCFVTLKSKNTESYMFHTPNIHLVKLQAQAAEIPLIEEKTDGEKEHELHDLKKALLQAKKQYNIEGVVTGALASHYQRARIEKVCDELSLKIFAPLWHINQEAYLHELVDAGFKVIIGAVAAEGLDKTWLGRELNATLIEKLLKVNRTTGLNVAFEGGEAESLVVDCPLFKKRLDIVRFDVHEDGKNCASMHITKAVLAEKEA